MVEEQRHRWQVLARCARRRGRVGCAEPNHAGGEAGINTPGAGVLFDNKGDDDSFGKPKNPSAEELLSQAAS